MKKIKLSKYDLNELIAIVRYLLCKSKEGLDKIHIAKIMYYAQQEHLVRYAMPMCADSFAAKKLGPVPVFVDYALNAVPQQEEITDDDVKQFIDGLHVTYKKNEDGKDIAIYSLLPEISYEKDDLSESAIEVLNQKLHDLEKVPSEELSRRSHEDIAWQRANAQFLRTGELAIMPLYDIAEAGGALPGVLEEIKEDQMLQSAWV